MSVEIHNQMSVETHYQMSVETHHQMSVETRVSYLSTDHLSDSRLAQARRAGHQTQLVGQRVGRA